MKHPLVGKKYTFEDGNVIEVIQVRDRDFDEGTVPFVTYLIYTGNSLPRKLVMRMDEFISTFGHLFGI
jgi:hypothetical protein